MFSRSIKIFDLLGFPIRVDASWVLLAVLVTWSLAHSAFPAFYPDFTPMTYWVMGVAGALLLFVSILYHELAHAIVARHYGLSIRSITLFIFGGVAEMEDQPPSAKAEFWVAIAGPLASIALAALMWLARYPLGIGSPAGATLSYLGTLNIVLAVFNMIPAFPLDGGRVLRAALWAARKNLRWATRVASEIGGWFGIGLVALGVLALVNGNMIAGLWWIMIGLFMRNASKMSYQQLLIRRALEGEPVSKFMARDVVSVPRMITIRQLLEEYVYKHHYKMYPVTEQGRLLGCVTIEDIRSTPRDDWDQRYVAEIMQPWPEEAVVAPSEDAMDALTRMSRMGRGRLLVMQDDLVLGILTLRDLLGFLRLKLDLEQGG